MREVAVVGLDLAKNVFQVRGVASDGAMLIRRQLRRAQPLDFFRALPSRLLDIEACASAHHWGRKLIALSH